MTETSAIQEKPALAETEVTIRYKPGTSEMFTTDDATTKFLRKKLQKATQDSLELGRVGGKIVAQAIMDLVLKIKK